MPFFKVWEISPGENKTPNRQEGLFIQPKVLGVKFGSSLDPTTLQTK